MLDFVLELNEQLPDDLDDEEVKSRISSFDADNLFSNEILGDNATILLGSSNTQVVSNENLKGNFELLSKTLEEHNVSKLEYIHP